MTAKELNLKLITAFPELKACYDEETSWQEGDDTGSHVVFGDVLKPYLLKNIYVKNTSVVGDILSFLEEILSLNDLYADEVVAFSVFEGIIDEEIDMLFIEAMLGSLSKKVWDELKGTL